MPAHQLPTVQAVQAPTLHSVLKPMMQQRTKQRTFLSKAYPEAIASFVCNTY